MSAVPTPIVATGHIPCHYHLWQYFSKCALVVVIVLEITLYWDNLEGETVFIIYTLCAIVIEAHQASPFLTLQNSERWAGLIDSEPH